MKNMTIMINFKSFKAPILIVIINHNCRKIIILIRYNRLLTPLFRCGFKNEKGRFLQDFIIQKVASTFGESCSAMLFNYFKYVYKKNHKNFKFQLIFVCLTNTCCTLGSKPNRNNVSSDQTYCFQPNSTGFLLFFQVFC